MAVVDVVSGLSYLAQADRVAGESLADEVATALELDATVVLHAPDLEVEVVLDGRQDGGVGPGAGCIARAGCEEVQRFMRTHEVVVGSPDIEVSLGLRVVPPDRALADHLQLEAAMEALVLALG